MYEPDGSSWTLVLGDNFGIYIENRGRGVVVVVVVATMNSVFPREKLNVRDVDDGHFLVTYPELDVDSDVIV